MPESLAPSWQAEWASGQTRAHFCHDVNSEVDIHHCHSVSPEWRCRGWASGEFIACCPEELQSSPPKAFSSAVAPQAGRPYPYPIRFGSSLRGPGSISVWHYSEPELVLLLSVQSAHSRGIVSIVLCPEHGLLFTGGNDKILSSGCKIFTGALNFPCVSCSASGNQSCGPVARLRKSWHLRGGLKAKGHAMESGTKRPFSACPAPLA